VSALVHAAKARFIAGRISSERAEVFFDSVEERDDIEERKVGGKMKDG